VATIGADGAPRLRTVVLRGAEPSARALRFHTDRRSAKVPEIAADPRVSVHFYDARAKVQLRIAARATIHGTDAVAEAAWQRTSEMGRRCYLEEPAPGTPSAAPTSGLTEAQEAAVPRGAAAEPGRANFAVVTLDVRSIEWLYLAARGHRRARFDWDEDGRPAQTWLVP
jgi:hypothetical protein